MPLSVVAAPATEPLTLSEAKLQLRLSTDDDNAVVTSLIPSARSVIEAVTRTALLTQQLRLTLPAFFNEIFLPRPPLQSVSTFTYLDADGATQTVDSSLYNVVSGNPSRITLATNQSWPETLEHPEAVTITFVAGYATVAEIPPKLMAALRLEIEQEYEGPDDILQKAIDRLTYGSRHHNSAAWEHIN